MEHYQNEDKPFYETLFIAIEANNFLKVKVLLDQQKFKITEFHMLKSIECNDIRIFKLLLIQFGKPCYNQNWVERIVELGRKDMILFNIEILNMEFPYYKFDLDFQFTVMKKYLIHRDRLLNNSYLFSSFVFEQFLRRLIISKNFSEDILFLKKLKNFIYWVNRTIFTSILKLEKANVNVIKRLLDNPWTPMYRSLYPQYDKFSKIFFKFLISSEREDAAKKIYFWWIPICYSLEHPSGCGQRMALKNYEKYLELHDLIPYFKTINK